MSKKSNNTNISVISKKDNESQNLNNNSNKDLDTNSLTFKKKKFESDYKLIQQMRKEKIAPVDNQGSTSCTQVCNKIDKKVLKFQCLVSLILSSQTKDNITFETTKKLIEYGLTIDKMLKISNEELVNLIFKASFHNVKAKTIKKLAQVLRYEYNDNAPETLEKVMKLPGIGRKIGLLYLKECCNKIEGIAVDTHIHKIANRLGWVDTKEPNKTSIDLENIVDKKYWNEINLILVGFGQQICKSVKPLCEKCLLCNVCDYYKNNIKGKNNKKEKKKSVKKSKSKEKSKNNKKSKSKDKSKSKEKNEEKSEIEEKMKNIEKNYKKGIEKIRKKAIEYESCSDSDSDD